MNLGNKIRELRRAAGLTQEQLAASLNITAQAVSKWEMGLSFPDMTMIPTLAGFFRVTLDELFDYDVTNIDKEVEKIRLEYNSCPDFARSEQILRDGLKLYPASIQLKTELFELYAYHLYNHGDDPGSDEILGNAFELAGQIIHTSQDVFCTCRTKENLILIYKYLEREKRQEHYGDIKRVIESLPYMYPYMLKDRMRLSAAHIRGEQGMAEAQKLRDIEWQELFIACRIVGNRYFEMEDYESARSAYQESVDVIERFMYPDKQGYEAYPIGGTHANHAMTVLDIAACMLRLGRTNSIDDLIGKAKHIYFDALGNIERGMIEYFTDEYNRKGLAEYKTLDLSEYGKSLGENKT